MRNPSTSITRMLLSTLRDAGYNVQSNVPVGRGPDGSRFRAKIVASYSDGPALVLSGHSQRRRGTTEYKIPWEVMTIASAIETEGGRLSSGYIVLSGSGWTLKDYFIRRGLDTYMKGIDRVHVITLDTFVEKVQAHSL